MSTEHAPCAMCGTVRHVEDLDDAMICVNNNCPPGTTGTAPAGYLVTVPRLECSPPTCTLTLDEHEGEGHEFGNPCSNGCVCDTRHGDPDFDPNEPHQWFQSGDVPEGDPYCSGCQLPAENVRHQGRFTAVVTIHGNDRDEVLAEITGLLDYLAEGDTDLWWGIDRTWE